MLRTCLALALSALFLAVGSLVSPAASANGILITPDGSPAIIERHGRHPMPHRPVPVVRLKGHRVRADLNDRVASVRVEQVFHNHGGRQLEGTYLFPLPEGAIVSQFAMTMGGKMVQGEIIEREKAREIYQRIVSRRRDPGLLEYMGRGLFRARVFPILPHSDLTIQLTYQQVLPEDEGTIELRYPLATDRLNSDAVQNVSVEFDVTSSVDIKTLYSPSHDVEVKRDGERKARVSYESNGQRQDKDMLLYVGRSADAVGFSMQSHKEPGQDGTFMAVFAPRTRIDPKDRVSKDVVYVLDKSGSMAGPKMDQARKALSYGIRLLREGDRFNVIAFSTNLYPFRDGLVDATGEMKEAAVSYVEGLEPSGGTNIDGALQQALKMRRDDRLFMVVFVTDGKPTVDVIDPDQIVKNVKSANTANTRIFTFGVGFDLDVNLLDRIAEVTSATRDYVMPGEDLELATGRFFRKVDQPVLTDVKVEFGSGITDVYPRLLPELFAGSQVVVFGRYKEAGPRTVILRGRIGTREIVYEHNTELVGKDGAGYLPRLWAARKVAYLLDEIRLHGENKELVDEVVRLATRYAIVTPYTAGLVVEEAEMTPADSRWEGGRRTARRRVRELDLGGLLPPRPQAQADRGGPAGSGPGLGGGAGMPAPTSPTPDPSGRPAGEDGKAKAAMDSERLKRLKDSPFEHADKEADGDDGLGAVRDLVKSVEGKTFVQDATGRWVDKAWDGKQETEKVEAFSEAYFKLLTKSDKVARFLALGEKVIFQLGTTVYEIVPAKTAPAK
jgi:Ca-activated chloride channel family protein